MEKVQRKLTGLGQYSAKFHKNGLQPIKKGEIIYVTEEEAEYIDSLYSTDKAGNKVPYFSEVEDGDDEEDHKAPRRGTRTRTVSKPAAAEDTGKKAKKKEATDGDQKGDHTGEEEDEGGDE